MIPSQFIANKLLSTEERILEKSPNIAKVIEFVKSPENHIGDFNVSVDLPLFKPEPTEIVLQNFSVDRSYEVVLKFKNLGIFS
jgi:hypothetical protein